MKNDTDEQYEKTEENVVKHLINLLLNEKNTNDKLSSSSSTNKIKNELSLIFQDDNEIPTSLKSQFKDNIFHEETDSDTDTTNKSQTKIENKNTEISKHEDTHKNDEKETEEYDDLVYTPSPSPFQVEQTQQPQPQSQTTEEILSRKNKLLKIIKQNNLFHAHCELINHVIQNNGERKLIAKSEQMEVSELCFGNYCTTPNTDKIILKMTAIRFLDILYLTNFLQKQYNIDIKCIIKEISDLIHKWTHGPKKFKSLEHYFLYDYPYKFEFVHMMKKYFSSPNVLAKLNNFLPNLPALNIEYTIMNKLSKLVMDDITPHLIIPIHSFICSRHIINFNEDKSDLYNDVNVTLMEYVNGGTLHELLTKWLIEDDGGITNEFLEIISFQIIFTLAHIQKRCCGFRHNDLYSDNIFVHKSPYVENSYNLYIYEEHEFVVPVPYIVVDGVKTAIEIVIADFGLSEIVDSELYNIYASFPDYGIQHTKCDYYDLHLIFNDLYSNVVNANNGIVRYENWLKMVKRNVLPEIFRGPSSSIGIRDNVSQQTIDNYVITNKNWRLSSQIQNDYVNGGTYPGCLHQDLKTIINETMSLTPIKLLSTNLFITFKENKKTKKPLLTQSDDIIFIQNVYGDNTLLNP